jgi:hypothetical protein
MEVLLDEQTRNQENSAVLKFKGIFQPFELGGVTRLIASAVKFCKAGHLKKNFLMIQSHERSLKQISAA